MKTLRRWNRRTWSDWKRFYYTAWGWKHPWPLVWRKNAIRERAAAQSFAAHQRDDEIAKIQEGVDRILPKLTALTAGMTRGKTLRVMQEIDAELMMQAFRYGNDQHMIGYFAERIGKMLERELKSINYLRYDFEEDPYRRRFVDPQEEMYRRNNPTISALVEPE